MNMYPNDFVQLKISEVPISKTLCSLEWKTANDKNAVARKAAHVFHLNFTTFAAKGRNIKR